VWHSSCYISRVKGQTDTPPEGIWTIDNEGKTLFASESMAKLLRTTVQELLGRPSFDYVFPEDAPSAQRLFESKSRGDMSSFEFRLRRSDGTPLWVSIQGTPMHDASGAFRGIIGTFRAIRRQNADRSVKSKEASVDT
jgi:two-component system, cell cycle sensor histidine kinase and response regulator CckA